MSQSKYQAGFGVIFWDKKSQTLMIPIYSTTVLYDYQVTKKGRHTQKAKSVQGVVLQKISIHVTKQIFKLVIG